MGARENARRRRQVLAGVLKVPFNILMDVKDYDAPPVYIIDARGAQPVSHSEAAKPGFFRRILGIDKKVA